MLKLSDLDFYFPEKLIATRPQRPSRVMWVEKDALEEISLSQLLEKFKPGDVLAINETKVSKRRIFAGDIEILFLENLKENLWKVLFPASRIKKTSKIKLPDGVEMELVESGLPQTVKLSRQIDETYFQTFGEIPLPPYIQKARNERHHKSEDETWYQTAWAKEVGSQAAPTASLHFSTEDLLVLQQRGVLVEKVILHVGLGTFLPVKQEDLSLHQMHGEWAYVGKNTWENILKAKENDSKIWCLGTTVTRTLESCASGKLSKNSNGDFEGETDLFIKDDFDFKICDVLLTNFHQPKTTLLALVAAFAGLDKVKNCYQWAIQKNFRLFSYGDLTAWKK